MRKCRSKFSMGYLVPGPDLRQKNDCSQEMWFSHNIHLSLLFNLFWSLYNNVAGIWYITKILWWWYHVLLGAKHNSWWPCHQPGEWQINCHQESLHSRTLCCQTQTFLHSSQDFRIQKQDKGCHMWIDTLTHKAQGYHLHNVWLKREQWQQRQWHWC